MSYEFCPTCGDDQFYETEDADDDHEVVECFSCRTPLKKDWLTLPEWTNRGVPGE